MAESSIRGQFVWHQLMTTDMTSAAAFYGKVAALKTQPVPGDPSFVLLVASAGRMGGLRTLGAEAKVTSASPTWLSYIGTLNVEESARQAASLGGKIIKPPADMGGGGRFAILQDPQGAVFAIYQSPQPYSPQATVPLGQCSWHELVTTDHAAAFAFYQQLFGWDTTSSMDMGPQGVYRMYGPAGAKEPFGGMYNKSPQQPGPAWLPYIKVADAKTATAKAKAAGAQIQHGPAEVPGGGWISTGIDPQGAMFAVHSVAAVAKPTSKPAAKATRKLKAAPKRKATPKRRAAPKKKAKAAPRRAKRRAGSKK